MYKAIFIVKITREWFVQVSNLNWTTLWMFYVIDPRTSLIQINKSNDQFH